MQRAPGRDPQDYGRFIKNYAYDPIAHGYVKAELDKLNFTGEGWRKARLQLEHSPVG